MALWIGLLAACGLAQAAHAQTIPSTRSGDAAREASDPSADVVKPIPLGDVGVMSERAKSQLQDARRSLEPSEAVRAAAAAIPDLTQQVETELERSEAVRSATPSVLAIDRLQSRWKNIEDALADNQAILRRRGSEIDQLASSARDTRAVWQATRTHAIELGVGRDVVQQIDDVLTSATGVITDATARQADIVGLQGTVARLSEIVAGDQKQIVAARNRVVGQALVRDTAPIWSADFWHRANPAKLVEQLVAQERRDAVSLAEFWAKERERVVLFAVATVLLVMLVFTARNRIDRRLAGESDLASVRAIFGRPIALSMLIAFFCSLWIFTELATTFEPLFGAATLIPAVLILRQILDRPLFPLLTVAVSVFFANNFREMIAEAEVLSRLIFMAEMLVLAVFAARTLRPSRLVGVPHEMLATPLFRVIGYGLRAVLVLSSVAFVAEAIGFGALADLIGGALVLSIYAAIVLYGTLRVLDGLVAYLIRVRPLRLLGMVARHQWLVRRRIAVALQFAAWFIWVRATLRRAEVWDDVTAIWRWLLAAELPFPEISITIGHLVAAGVVFWGALLLSRFLQFALAEDVYSRMTLPKGRPYAISTLLHYSFLILGLVLAAAALGFDANRATLLTGAFGVGIGFGLQTIVNNFISGIIVLTERPIQVGDSIALGPVTGEVTRIGIRSTTVRTWQGAEVIVPNADLIAQQVTNWTKSDRRRRIEIPVGVAYGSDPQLVIETLLGAVRGVEKVLSDPEPVVLFKGFGDSALDFEVRAWTGDFDSSMQTLSAICVRMTSALAEAGLEVPFPQRDLHLKTVAEGARAMGLPVGDLAPVQAEDDERRTG